MSEDEKKEKKPLKGTGGDFAGSSITEDEESRENEMSSAKIITGFKGTCPVCHSVISDPSAFNEHLKSHTNKG